jgi:hypothetical protein
MAGSILGVIFGFLVFRFSDREEDSFIGLIVCGVILFLVFGDAPSRNVPAGYCETPMPAPILCAD